MSERHDDDQRRSVWPPSPGWFALRQVKGGWQVPARIFHQDGLWWAEIDQVLKPPHPDPALAEGVADIWHGGTITDEADHHWRLAVKQQAADTGEAAHPSLKSAPAHIADETSTHHAATEEPHMTTIELDALEVFIDAANDTDTELTAREIWRMLRYLDAHGWQLSRKPEPVIDAEPTEAFRPQAAQPKVTDIPDEVSF